MVLQFLESLLLPEKLLLLFTVLFIVRFTVFTTLENFFRAKAFNRFEVVISDLLTMLMYTVIIFPVAHYLSNHIGIKGSFLSSLSHFPLALRILLFFIVADFLHYWIHRLMHQPVLWNIHKWHHSPTHMSWMSGFRATIFDAVLVNLAFIFAWPILGNITYGTTIFILICNLLINDWMHLNVSFRMPYLEKIMISPRYHHIHHSNASEHYTKNLAAIFPIWDKLFGTYVNPDNVQELNFGLDKKVPTSRLVLGL